MITVIADNKEISVEWVEFSDRALTCKVDPSVLGAKDNLHLHICPTTPVKQVMEEITMVVSALDNLGFDGDSEQVGVCKDPKTDSKKKSAKGLLRVELENGKYVLYDQQTPEQEEQGELKTVFKDGLLLVDHSLEDIRQRVKESL